MTLTLIKLCFYLCMSCFFCFIVLSGTIEFNTINQEETLQQFNVDVFQKISVTVWNLTQTKRPWTVLCVASRCVIVQWATSNNIKRHLTLPGLLSASFVCNIFNNNIIKVSCCCQRSKVSGQSSRQRMYLICTILMVVFSSSSPSSLTRHNECRCYCRRVASSYRHTLIAVVSSPISLCLHFYYYWTGRYL